MESLKEEPEVLDIVKGDDLQAFQELLKSVYQVRNGERLVVFCQSDSPRESDYIYFKHIYIRYEHIVYCLSANTCKCGQRRLRRKGFKINQGMAERTIDAQRVSATVPRDTVQLYEQLRESGLQYGPAFRLLRNVHTPDV